MSGKKGNAKGKENGDARTTKDLKALLKKKGVRFTQIMDLAGMVEIADHPGREKQVIERVCKRWKDYLKKLEERKKQK